MIPRVHAVTDARILWAGDLAWRVTRLRPFGAHLAIHVRDRTASAHHLARRAEEVAAWLAGSEVALVVNARPDIARVVGAYGTQVGREDLAPHDVRVVYPAGRIGTSTHSRDEATHARALGADWAFLGPLFTTPTHPGATPLGPLPLHDQDLPVVGIGGITLEHAVPLREAGYHGVAAIRAIWDAPDPAAAVAQVLGAWEDGTG